MKQPSEQTIKLLLNLMKKTSLPRIIEQENQKQKVS
jgi:hypothetical protein